MKKTISTFLIFFVFIQLYFIQSANAAIPSINSYITDTSGILSPASKSQLENDLRSIEKQTSGVQFIVYIENEYQKEFSLEEYTLKIAENNKLGKKGNDNGVLLYIAVKDRKYRWEIGYGAESVLNSALLGRISRDYLVPNFRSNDYEKGIVQAVDVVKRLLLNSNDADIVALRNSHEKIDFFSKSIFLNFSVIFIIFVIFMIISSFYRAIKNAKKISKNGKHKDNIYHGAALGLFAGGFGRGGFNSGSGGFGGFSGGGGGFGGGGSSGGW